ncbi:MAG: ABC transporter substrate-binding protein [Pseudomonadota bacterium]
MKKETNSVGATVGDTVEFGQFGSADRDFVVNALNKGASRRDVMGWLVAMGATVAAASSVVASATDAIAATPKKGGKLRFAWDLHGPSDTLDPILFTSSIDYGRGRLNYSSLTRLQDDLTVAPEVAESFEANADATEWTFKLRKDVEFHDGSKLTADDVVYSMSRHLGKDSKSKAKVLVADVKEWKKDDDYTVKAILSAPNSELPIILGTFHFKLVKNGTTDFSNPVGSGPYKTTEFTPGVRSKHVRNDNYFGDGGPYVDEYEVFGITDNVARVNALINGDIDMMGNLDPKSVPQIEQASGVEVFALPSGAYMDIICRYDNGPAGANNGDLIKGLKLLQRRDRVLKRVQKGIGDIGNDQPIGPAYGAMYAKSQEIGAYDPDKAKFHLKKAGITSAELNVAEVGPGLTQICELLQRECQKVGFNLNLKKVPNDGYWGAIWNKAPMHVSSWNMRPSANIMMTLAYKSDAPWNESAWKEPKLDKLLSDMKAELDPAKRLEYSTAAQKMISEGAGTLISTHRAYIDAKSTKVKGFPKVPVGAFGGMEWPEFLYVDA